MKPRAVPHAALLFVVLAVLLLLPNLLRSTGPIALRCDNASISALYFSNPACFAAAENRSCVCLPIAQSIGYTSLPLYLQVMVIMLAAISWTLKTSGPRRLLLLNVAVVLAVLVDAVILAMPGGWSLLILIYSPLVAFAASLLASTCYLATAWAAARAARRRPDGVR